MKLWDHPKVLNDIIKGQKFLWNLNLTVIWSIIHQQDITCTNIFIYQKNSTNILSAIDCYGYDDYSSNFLSSSQDLFFFFFPHDVNIGITETKTLCGTGL